MNKKIIFLNLLILIGLFSCEKKLKNTSLEQNTHIRSEINKLTELNISIKENSKEFRELPYSLEEGYYEIYNNGTYDIVRFPYSEINKNKILSTSFGSIIGTNVGEWGGELFFRSIYGGHNTYTIIEDNIVDIFRYKNGIYVLTGLSHLTSSSGNIVKLKYTEEKWDVDFIIELDSCPYVKTIFEDYIYIVTGDGITVFDGNDIKEINKGNWKYLNPQSIYVNNEIIAIGLKGCIAIINKEDNKIEYFKK